MTTQPYQKGANEPKSMVITRSPKAERLEDWQVELVLVHHWKCRQEVTPGLFASFHDYWAHDDYCVAFSETPATEVIIAFTSEVLRAYGSSVQNGVGIAARKGDGKANVPT